MPPQTVKTMLSSSDDDMLLDVDMASKTMKEESGVEPHEHDVLCGRGGNINIHPGNARFRQKVESRKRCYIDARFKREKRLIAESIIKDIKRLDPPGRFLTRDNKDGPWYEISEEKARDKTSQALRENAPKIRKEIQDQKERAEAEKMAAQQRFESRHEEMRRKHDRDHEPIRYDNIMNTMANKFGCPGRLEDVQDNYYNTPRRNNTSHDMHRENGREDFRRRPGYSYDYEPNEYGLPRSNRYPHNGEVSPDSNYVFNKRPGLPARREGNIVDMEHTYNYRPNEYRHYDERRRDQRPNDCAYHDERRRDQRYDYMNEPSSYDRHYGAHQNDDNHRAWQYRNAPPQSRLTDSDEYSEHLIYNADSATPYQYDEHRPTKRAREGDDPELKSFANAWTRNNQYNKSREDVLALMDSLSMEDTDNERNSDDPRTPPPEEERRAATPDNSEWIFQGCHFNDALKRTIYGDDNIASPVHSIDMDDQSSSARSLNGASLMNVFEESTRNIQSSTRNIKESMMSLGDSFFNSMNINFSTDDDL